MTTPGSLNLVDVPPNWPPSQLLHRSDRRMVQLWLGSLGNKVGAGPLDQCHVSSVRPGRAVTQTVPAGGGDTVQKVQYTPVYVDVAC